MKRLISMLLAVLLLVAPALAEEEALQLAANAAYARVLLEGEDYIPLTDDARMPAEWEPVRFTLLDMDHDGVNEAIVELTNWEAFIILFWYGETGEVYGAEIVYRGLLDLKDDGTSSFSSGAMDGGVSSLCLAVNSETNKPDAIGRFHLAESATMPDGSIRYTLDCGVEETDEAGYQAFLAEQDAKLDALWYDYTEENLKLLLGQ